MVTSTSDVVLLQHGCNVYAVKHTNSVPCGLQLESLVMEKGKGPAPQSEVISVQHDIDEFQF
jgi:hypothetical protein